MGKLIHLNQDLLLASKLRIAATRCGLIYQAAGSFETFANIPIEDSVLAVAIDLQTQGLNLEKLAAHIRNSRIESQSVWLYAQHVQESLLEQAANLGVGEVFTRGKFDRSLDQMVSRVATSHG